MSIQCNGQVIPLDSDQCLVDVLRRYSITVETKGVAVSLNERIVLRSCWSSTQIKHGDRIEVVHAVQGG